MTAKLTRILVVDDEPELAQMVAEILALEGYIVDQAADGAEALRMIGQQHYDAILTDVVMPVMDGPALYQELEQFEPALCRRTAFMAARFDAVDRLRAVGLPVIAKPFDVAELHRVMRLLLTMT